MGGDEARARSRSTSRRCRRRWRRGRGRRPCVAARAAAGAPCPPASARGRQDRVQKPAAASRSREDRGRARIWREVRSSLPGSEQRSASRASASLVAALGVALTTLLSTRSTEVAPVVSLGVVYLLAVLVVSTCWGVVARRSRPRSRSALAFNFFHIPPTGRFTIADGENWVALVVFLVAAVVASSVAERRPRRAPPRPSSAAARPTSRPRWRGCCSRGDDLRDGAAGRGRSGWRRRSGLPSAAIELRPVGGDDRARRVPAARGRAADRHARWCPPARPRRRCGALQERVVPALEALLAAALERDALLSRGRRDRGAAPQRRGQDRAAARGLARPALAADRDRRGRRGARARRRSSDAERARARAGDRRARRSGCRGSIDKLLDLSRLEAGAAEPRPRLGRRSRRSCARRVDDARPAAGRRSPRARPRPAARARRRRPARARVREPARERAPPLRRAPGVGPRARASAAGCSCGSSTAARASRRPSASGSSSRSTARAPTSTGHRGSGLGLAIAAGFVEANGGRDLGRVAARARGRPSWSSSRSSRRPAPRRRGRGVSATAPRVLVCDDEPQILRALRVVLRDAGFEVVPAATAEEALDRAAVQPARRGDHRPRAARRRRRRGLPRGCASGARCRSSCCRRSARRTQKVARAGGRRRRLRHQAVRPARARRAAAGRAAPRAATAADEPVLARRRAGDRPRARASCARDGEEVHLTPIEFDLLRALMPQPRAAADAPRAAHRGLGPGVRRRHRRAAHAHREPAPQDRARRRPRALHPHGPRRRLPLRRGRLS